MHDYALRRRRRRPSYQEFLAGDVEDIVAADTAGDASAMNPTVKAVLIGVTTGAITLVVNRLVERFFFGK